MFKKLLAVLTVAVVATGIATAAQLRDDHPQTYVVKKGDTLWSISRKFLRDPWNWPEIWHANQQVRNPHLIYPGDVLTLVYNNGQPGLAKLQPSMRETDTAITAVPLDEIGPFLGKTRVLQNEEFKNAPYVLTAEEGEIRGEAPRRIYVRGSGLVPGQRWAVVRPTITWWEIPERFPWKSSDKIRVADDWDSTQHKTIGTFWRDVYRHRAKFKKYSRELGREVVQVATADVISTGDPNTLAVAESDFEIKQGDILVPLDLNPYDATYFPRGVRAAPENMRVLGVEFGAYRTVGNHDVIAVTHGKKDGVANGDVFAVYHPQGKVRDNVKYAEDDFRTAFTPKKAKVKLPDEQVAHVMVFRAFDYMSYAIVMEGTRPVQVGDKLMAP